MATAQQDSHTKYLEWFKWIIPIAFSFIGWYVSQVIAPITSKLSEVEKQLESIHPKVHQFEYDRTNIIKRLDIIEEKAETIKDNYMKKDDFYREIRRLHSKTEG